MKKFVSLVLAAISILCLSSCSEAEETRGDVKFPEVITGSSFSGGSHGDSHGDVYYLSFEDVCAKATNVVVAVCTGIEDDYWTFDVQERLLGDAEDKIWMSQGGSTTLITSLGGNDGHEAITYYEDMMYFEEGERYLLVLEKSCSIYHAKRSISYYTSRATTISLDNLSESQMYNESAKRHIKGIDIDTCSEEEMVEYVRELVKNNKTEKTISKAETLEEIVQDSTDIVHIKIGDPVKKIKTSYHKSEIWECKIIETLKGDLEKGSVVKIEFLPNVVIPGKEYVVALDDYFKVSEEALTTKDSLRPLSEKEEIKSYID